MKLLLKDANMKNLKFLVFIIPVFLFACNNQKQKADKNMNNDAMVVKNAKVEAETAPGSEPKSAEDFVKQATIGGLMEVELGRYAEQNASNPRVKNFGAMMVRDHTKGNEELKSIATGKRLEVPSAIDNQHMNDINELEQIKGTEFDSEYIKDMVDDHEKDVSEFKNQAENGKDAEIKSFASRTLPILQAHLDSAKNIRNAIAK